jgi:hypothetical protein
MKGAYVCGISNVVWATGATAAPTAAPTAALTQREISYLKRQVAARCIASALLQKGSSGQELLVEVLQPCAVRTTATLHPRAADCQRR